MGGTLAVPFSVSCQVGSLVRAQGSFGLLSVGYCIVLSAHTPYWVSRCLSLLLGRLGFVLRFGCTQAGSLSRFCSWIAAACTSAAVVPVVLF